VPPYLVMSGHSWTARSSLGTNSLRPILGLACLAGLSQMNVCRYLGDKRGFSPNQDLCELLMEVEEVHKKKMQ